MSKKMTYDMEARELIKEGVDALANAVKVTLGPRGRNVIIERGYGPPVITKDGVTVAREIELENAIPNIGAQTVKNVASKTNDLAGDGTTTATVLAQSIIATGMKNVTAGANPIELKRGIDLAVAETVKRIKSISLPVNDDHDLITQIATVSANNDTEIGEIIAAAVTKVTREGVVTIEDSNSTQTIIETVEGMQIDRGTLSPYFITDQEKHQVVLENPYILLYDRKITQAKQILGLLEMVNKESRGILIIAEDVDSEALGTMVVNKLRGSLRVCAIKAPAFGERRKDVLEDIAVLTGGIVVSEAKGHKLEDINVHFLGQAQKIVIDKSTTTIINGVGEKKHINGRVNEIKSAIERSQSEYDKEQLRERLAKVIGGIAVIKVGAGSELELKEKKDRYEDALNATNAAIEEGVVPGGGIAYIRAIPFLKKLKGENADQTIGIQIIMKALESPSRQIAENAGIEGSVVIHKVSQKVGNAGYNVVTGEYGNMLKMGIIDPAKVTRVAIENAGSIAGMLLTTECVVSIIPVPQGTAEPQPQMPPGFPGMM